MYYIIKNDCFYHIIACRTEKNDILLRSIPDSILICISESLYFNEVKRDAVACAPVVFCEVYSRVHEERA